MTGYGGSLLIAFQTLHFVLLILLKIAIHPTALASIVWPGQDGAKLGPSRGGRLHPCSSSHRQSQTCNSQIVTFSVFLAVTALTQESQAGVQILQW